MAITYTTAEEASNEYPVGTVIRQDPEPGLVGPDTEVTLYISTGSVGSLTAMVFSVTPFRMAFSVS